LTQTPYAGKHLGPDGNEEPAFFKEIYCTESIYTVRTRINYKTVPVNKLNKYLHYGTSGTE